MSLLVQRTCTEIHMDRQGGVSHSESKPLSGFRSRPALVLLGDAGAGKTTEFEKECRELGSAAEYVTARNFITLDVESRKEWRDRTLFIDGLDEIRAGATDSRKPLDEVRNRLDQLRPPGFRISCREADWLGRNDRENLAVVAPRDSRLTVVRLDPLDDDAINQLLEAQVQSGADDLIVEFRRRGIWPLLKNPLMLRLLVEAIGEGEQWPECRKETFQMACRKLATEQNQEHRFGGSLSPEDAEQAAGYLCALQLLADLEGYSPDRSQKGSGWVGVADVNKAPQIQREALRGALGTNLFKAGSEGFFRPVHRQVGEFIGGRYLGDLIKAGLPPRRVLSLMTSPSDGYVVTALRGLSAWLAVHCPEARDLLIEADPVGVGLYGDIGDFTRNDKIRLLESLAKVAKREPPSVLFPLYGDYKAWSLRSLASADMADVINNLIVGQGEASPGDTVVSFLCRILSQIDQDAGAFVSLAPRLYALVRDVERDSWMRTDALDAFLNVAPTSEIRDIELKDLLQDSQDSPLLDPDDEIRGTLLKLLYPDRLSAAQVWRYAAPRNRRSLFGRYWRFWNGDLADVSSKQQIADLLDALHSGADEILPGLVDARLDDLPLRLLAHAVQRTGDEVTVDRLDNWLNIVSHPHLRGRNAEQRDVEVIRTWLEERPRIQKGIILKRLAADAAENGYGSSLPAVRRTLQGSRLPPDLGLWSLEQALARAATEPALSVKLLRLAHRTLNDQSLSEGLTLVKIRREVQGNPDLTREFDKLELAGTAVGLDSEDEWRREMDELVKRNRAERRQERAEWRQLLSKHESELWSNTFSPPNLHTLALVYFRALDDDASGSPFERLCRFIGGDRHLTGAVMSALREALWRDDVPEVDETILIASESEMPYLANPVLASMHLLVDGGDPAPPVGDAQKRRGLAMYYLFPLNRQETRRCVAAWFRHDPVLVLDILHRCAVAAIRKGEEYIPAVGELELFEGHEHLVHTARLRLLDAFPARIPTKQIPQFDSLLGRALNHSDTAPLLRLAERKLGLKSLSVGHRVRWMIVTAFLLGGSHVGLLETYVTTERRVRHVADSLAGILEYRRRDSILTHWEDSEFLAGLIRILGPSYRPHELDEATRITVEIRVSRLLEGVVGQMSKLPDSQTRDRLEALVNRPELARWRDRLTWALQTQRVLLRDASYDPPDVAQVQATLNNLAPANANDLAALLCDHIASISDSIRGGSTNLWRQFWNEDSHRRTTESRHEDSCRDVLLEMLKHRLPDGIDATGEGRYAADKRADIRVSYAGFNVPIEIKKNSHAGLWSALRSQLIDQYTTDPATSGYGVYLVLWLGASKTAHLPTGTRPATPEDLRQQLRGRLTSDEKRRISVIVIDVTKPGQPATAP